ncbi:MAG: helix-turn-helix domain-containing protein [Oscillospiraceae bacterium]|nr:helix-turn-helix domain-containing protein [Oscillospiraceae bacterium]
MENNVYTLQEVANNLKCSVSTIRNLIKRGQLQSMRVGNRHRITEEQLQAYKKAQSGNAHNDNPVKEETVSLPESWLKKN